MKMNWWLRLYTIPTLTEVAKAAGISLAIDLLTSHFLNMTESGYGLIAYIFLCYRIFSEIYQSGMGRNIAFHKSHHNFNELDKALTGESMAYSLGVVSIIWMTIIFSNLFGGGFDSSSGIGNLLFHSFSISLLGSIAIFLFLSNFRMYDKKVESPLKKMGVIGKLVYFFTGYALIIFFAFASIFIASLFKLEIETLGIIIAMGFTIAGIIDRRRLYFHLRKKDHTIRSYIKWSVPGLAGTVALFFVISLFVGSDFNNKKLSAENKVLTLDTWSNFSPRFELDVFKTILPYTNYTDADLAYMKAPEGFKEIPVEEVLTEFTVENVTHYFSYSEPTERNMKYLSEYMFANIDKWKDEYLAQRLVDRVTSKCKKCWVSDHERKLITEKTKFKWPKEIQIEKRSIASEPVETESEEI